jgi:hypothetical protein
LEQSRAVGPAGRSHPVDLADVTAAVEPALPHGWPSCWRSRAALAALKARGKKLGAANPRCRNLTDDARAQGHARAATVRKARADGFASDIAPLAAELVTAGRSLRQIAAALNDQGFETRRGKPWTGIAVSRVLARAGV